MKVALLVCGVLLATALDAVAQVKWYSLEEAQVMASEVPKPIFMDFTAKWCTWCKKMDKTTFENGKVADRLNSDFYPVKVDFDNKTPTNLGGKEFDSRKAMAEYFGVRGLPTTVVYDLEKKKPTSIVGFKDAKAMLKALSQF